MSKDKSRLDFIQDTKLYVIGGDYFTVIDADTDGPEYRYKKAETVREAIDNAMSEIGVSQGAESHGWIKCSDRLPPVNEDGESCSVLLYGMDILSDFGSHQFIGYLMDSKFYCDDGHSPHQCYYVSHWQPLPPPPAE